VARDPRVGLARKRTRRRLGDKSTSGERGGVFPAPLRGARSEWLQAVPPHEGSRGDEEVREQCVASGVEVQAVACDISMDKVAGYKAGEANKDTLTGIDGPLRMWLAPMPNGSYVPVKIQADTDDIGKVTLQDTEGTVFDTVQFAANFAVGGEIEEQLGTVIQLMLGIIAHQQDQPAAAIAQLSDLESGDSLATLARDMMLADSYLSTGQAAMADSTYNRILEQHPEYWLGWYNRGMLSLQRGDYDQAIYDLNNRLQLNDKDTSALAGLGQAYLARGQLIEAEHSFERAQLLAPGSSTLNRRLEIVRDSIQLQQNLLRDAEERLQRNPDDAKALHQKTKSSYQLGDPAAAIAAGERLQQLSTGDRATLTTLARAYQETNQLEKAQEVIRRAATQGLIRPDSARQLNRQLRVRNLPPPRN